MDQADGPAPADVEKVIDTLEQIKVELAGVQIRRGQIAEQIAVLKGEAGLLVRREFELKTTLRTMNRILNDQVTADRPAEQAERELESNTTPPPAQQ